MMVTIHLLGQILIVYSNILLSVVKTKAKPATIHGCECWAVKKKNNTQKLHTIDMRMLRLATGNTKNDHIRNEDIWREANIESMTTFLRKRRLRWYGHLLRKEGEGGYHQEDPSTVFVGGKEKKGEIK